MASQHHDPWQSLLLDAWKEGQRGWAMPVCLASTAPRVEEAPACPLLIPSLPCSITALPKEQLID